jgi:hypothetical protein
MTQAPNPTAAPLPETQARRRRFLASSATWLVGIRLAAVPGLAGAAPPLSTAAPAAATGSAATEPPFVLHL